MDQRISRIVDSQRFSSLRMGRALYAQLLGQEDREWKAAELADAVRSSLSDVRLSDVDMKMAVNRGFDSLVWDGFITHDLDGYVHVVSSGCGMLGLPNQHAAHYLAAAKAGAVNAGSPLVDRLKWVDETADARAAVRSGSQ